MDRSTLRLPDPEAGANGERRRSVRQKLHTPVYASFNGPETGMVVDLSELLDLHEEGFAVRTSEPLEVNRAVTLCLDLPETRSFIHGSGQVIWSDDAGRGGIRFSPLTESSRQILKEWLFANLLIACSNHAARTEQLAHCEEEKSPEPILLAKAATVIPISDGSGTLASLEAVRREVREIGDDVDTVFQLITERAVGLTGANGAALAFLTDDRMICRALAGEPGPPIGAPVDVKQGLSGECVRSGLLVSCENLENDLRVDPEIGRALGIGSLMAAPIVSDFRVVGLLEVFSPHPSSFTKDHGIVLERLVEMIPKTHRDAMPHQNARPGEARMDPLIGPEDVPGASRPPAAEPGSIKPVLIEPDSMLATRDVLHGEEPEVAKQVLRQVTGLAASRLIPDEVSKASTGPSRLHLGLLGLVIVVVFVALDYLVGPQIEKRWAASPQLSQPSFVKGAEAAPPVSDPVPVKSLTELQRLANQGDADAQWQMAVRYHDGEGVPQSDTQAMLWFQLAAEQGHVDAQAHLGAYYWAGRGVPQDLSKAYFWSTIALANGDENSKSRLEGLASQMTRAQVSAARQQAEVWLRSHSQRAKSQAN